MLTYQESWTPLFGTHQDLSTKQHKIVNLLYRVNLLVVRVMAWGCRKTGIFQKRLFEAYLHF